jgi:molybdenum cofactor cytidylyltransferase
MKFERVPLDEATGHILGHNVFRDGAEILGKGKRLGASELARLRDAGVDAVYVARLEPGDVLENEAAVRIARALVLGDRNVVYKGAATGRVTIKASKRGVLRVDASALTALNRVRGVTLAVRPPHVVLEAQRPAATLKIIPYAVPETDVARAVEIAAAGVVRVDELVPKRVALVSFGGRGREADVLAPFVEPMRTRLAKLGGGELATEYVVDEGDAEASLADAIARAASSSDLVIVAGETATMDEHDLAPSAVRRAGGSVQAVGAPVFPGNLLVVGYLGATAILGAPGCSRHPAHNVVDLVLPRLLAGERMGRDDVASLGIGGLITAADTEDEP